MSDHARTDPQGVAPDVAPGVDPDVAPGVDPDVEAEPSPAGRISHPVVAATLSVTMRVFQRIRGRLLADAAGSVLDVGAGVGLNFAELERGLREGRIDRLSAVEPDPHMRRRAAKRAEELAIEVDLQPTRGEQLPYDDASFDTVVITFVLCSVGSLERTVQEAHRVLKPGGQLLFAEHVRSKSPGWARAQDGLNGLWCRFAGGCQLNRDSLAAIQSTFAHVDSYEHGRAKRSLMPVISGRARP